jgi:hypothetical protein
MLLILLGEILIGYLAYRRAKANGTLTKPAAKSAERNTYVSQPLPPDATRLQKIAHWLGLEETPEEEK